MVMTDDVHTVHTVHTKNTAVHTIIVTTYDGGVHNVAEQYEHRT